MSLVGSIDQGTSSSRFVVYDEAGAVVASAQRKFDLIFPQPGWAELDPNDILETVGHCMKTVHVELGAKRAKRLAGIGITNQRETTLVWDRNTGKPLYNAIVWLDTRTSGTVDKMVAKGGGDKDHLRAVCGLPLSTYFSALKLRWLLDEVEAVRAAFADGTAMFGTVDSWLIWNLTGASDGGAHVTDVTNASRTMLMELASGTWSDRALTFFGISKAALPEIRSSAETYGEVKSGPFAGAPVCGCLGDQQAALVGQLCFQRGEAKNTYGTGCFMLLNTGTEPVQSKNGLLSTAAFQLGAQAPVHYALEGSIAIAGAGVKWLIQNMQLVKDVKELNELAASVSDTGGMCFVPALSGLLAPHWDDHARGTMVGMSQYTTRAHICRAMLEAVCFQTREVFDAMRDDSGVALTRLKVDGGMSLSDLMMQIQADLVEIPVVRAANAETTALGAALAAGLAAGVWKSTDELVERLQASAIGSTFKPADGRAPVAERCAVWKKAVERSLGWAENG